MWLFKPKMKPSQKNLVVRNNEMQLYGFKIFFMNSAQ